MSEAEIQPSDPAESVPDDVPPTGQVEARRMVPGIRVILPKLVIAGVFPAVGYALLRPHVQSDVVALAAVMVFPLADITVERVRHGRFEPIGVIALVGIVIGLIGAVAFHGDPTMLKLRESMLTGVFGLVCLGSLLARRPAMFHLGRAFATSGDAAAAAQFETIWDRPGAPRRFRRVTAAWGVGLLSETALRATLAVTVSTGRFLAVGPLIGWTVIGTLIWFSVRTIRAGEREALAADSPPAVA